MATKVSKSMDECGVVSKKFCMVLCFYGVYHQTDNLYLFLTSSKKPQYINPLSFNVLIKTENKTINYEKIKKKWDDT